MTHSRLCDFVALLELMRALTKDLLRSVHICIESTHSYHEALTYLLHDQGLHIPVVYPPLVKRFAEAAGLRNKIDWGDAKCFAQFCKMHKPSQPLRRPCA